MLLHINVQDKKINMKKILLIIFMTLNISAEVSSEISRFQKIGTINENTIKNMERFQYMGLQKIKGFEIGKYDNLINNIKKDVNNIDMDLINSIKRYSGDEYMTKDEYKQVVKKVISARKNIQENEISEYIIYLTSESVPNAAYVDILHSVGILQENGVKIKTKQYLVGPPDKFEEFMIEKKDYINGLTEKERGYILHNFTLKLDPRLFELFKAKKVPVIIYGVCKGKNPVKEKCLFKYLIRGDGSLTYFFDKIAEIEPKYKKYYEYLIGNKIINNQNEDIK